MLNVKPCFDSSPTNRLSASASGHLGHKRGICLSHGGIPIQGRGLFCIREFNGFFQFSLPLGQLPEFLLISKSDGFLPLPQPARTRSPPIPKREKSLSMNFLLSILLYLQSFSLLSEKEVKDFQSTPVKRMGIRSSTSSLRRGIQSR